ncbi:HpcH/HpaI aldolase/citrate lyase family protein [Cognatishimia sp. SS12]|uniref:HpcH/HpaI aldolase/citrate lyase family protein n=1 Tax=Cognatishimia sp. SS12 TaxID=2979465 RepID=UPI00232D8C18|nr:HpcH/HpaI aldolase/citrate lyase family protein [Cognatishimia sp. SS12]MDC0738920.1 HpcH/HpaI aldolase/citrate lyase family protein [Cognatishimia sp. SS12]
MSAPENRFKKRLNSGQIQFGCWLGMAEPYVAEMAALCGFDVLVIDGEHAPVDMKSMLGQLKALEGSPSQPLLRLPVDQTHLVKQALDFGAQNLLIPMIESKEQAEAMAKAMRYPPHGIRGVGAGMARASKFSMIADYQQTADDQVCVMLQVESRAGLDALDDILAVEGIDGVFIGPGDLSANLGYAETPKHPEFKAIVKDALTRIKAAGRAAGIIETDDDYIQQYIDLGVDFIATDVDVALYMNAMRKAARRYSGPDAAETGDISGY